VLGVGAHGARRYGAALQLADSELGGMATKTVCGGRPDVAAPERAGPWTRPCGLWG